MYTGYLGRALVAYGDVEVASLWVAMIGDEDCKRAESNSPFVSWVDDGR